MSPDFNILISFGNKDTLVSGSYTEDEFAKLENYLSAVDAITNSNYLKNGAKSSLNINMSNQTLSFTGEMPQPDEIFAFLHLLRPIILQNEATNFYKICNILKRNIENAIIRTSIDTHKDIYSGKISQKIIKYTVDDRVINSEEFALYYLNAFEYHRDKANQAIISELNKILPDTAMRIIFLSQLNEMVISMCEIANIINLTLGRITSIDKLLIRN